MFKSITHPGTLKKITIQAHWIAKKINKPCLVINYGSHVVNLEYRASDIDFLIIVKTLSAPQRQTFKHKGSSITANIISIKDLHLDARGKYGGYYISKLITPWNQVSGNTEFVAKVHQALGSFMRWYSAGTMSSGFYNVKSFVRGFYRAYEEGTIFYKSHTSRWPKNTWKYIEKMFRISLKIPDDIAAVHIQYPTKTNLERTVFRQIYLMRWVAFGLRLRGVATKFPENYIQKRIRRML